MESIDSLLKSNARPQLYEAGEPKFWDDPYISKKMLEAHLNPKHDAASRRPEIIEQTIRHLFNSQILKPGMKLLDLGCGPGLYAEKLCLGGVEVVGLDISENSIKYAKEKAEGENLNIQYHCMNFFDMDYEGEFDAVIQVYGELCTFSDAGRDSLLTKIHRALKDKGIFIFDVSTRELRKKEGLGNSWYMSKGGFWSPNQHLVLERGFDYPEADVWLDQYIVIDNEATRIYRNWFHDYSIATIKPVLEATGFEIKHLWKDLTGSSFDEGGDWIAIGAVKK